MLPVSKNQVMPSSLLISMILPLHYAPTPELAEYISSYGILEINEDISASYISPPLGLSGFIISLFGTYHIKLRGANFLTHLHCATGQVTMPMVGEIYGKQKGLMVFMNPLGMYQLFGCTMSHLTDTSLPLKEFLGDEDYETLMQQLTAHDDNDAQIQVLNDFFCSQLPVFEVAESVRKALDYIHLHNGNVVIKDVEEVCFMTRRSLERHFQVCIGLSPKVYAKIIRFKYVMNYLKEHPGITWAELGEESGFFDHSHLTRYFTEYLLTKPHEIVNLNMDFINHLLQEQ